jgi:hypothetical protein
MLVVMVHNDGKGDNSSAIYDVEVRINHTPIWRGRVTGHNRDDGWPTLLRMVAEQAESPSINGIDRSG